MARRYQCGPTVYDTAHIGHACTYVRFDVIRRILTDHFGLQVLMVQGVTDVDDKIIARAHERGIPALELAQYYEAEFADQMAALNVKAPTVQARVTEHIPQIVSFIEGIAARGHAYETEWGVYFDTAAFSAEPQHTYGKLQPKI